jgi:hypothetical protein
LGSVGVVLAVAELQQPSLGHDLETDEGDVPFGESDQGVGEFFAIVGIATTKDYAVGERLNGIPAEATSTKLKIVKRPR